MPAVDQEPSRPPFSWRRSVLPLCLAAAIVYLFTLLATIPARTALHWAGNDIRLSSASGTLWHGNAVLQDGMVLEWRARPLASITRLTLVADWELRGANTDLTGQAGLRPERIKMSDVRGRASWPLLSMLSGASATCDLEVIIDVEQLTIGKAYAIGGEARTPGGECRTTPEADPIAIPALSLTSSIEDDRSTMSVTPSTSPDTIYLKARLTEAGYLSVELTDSGAALLPAGMPRGAMSLEMEL